MFSRVRQFWVSALLLLAALTCVRGASANHGAEVDLSTPRRALSAFVSAAKTGEHLHAANVLDLRKIPSKDRASRGPELARQLKLVLDRALWIAPEELSDSPEGTPKDGALSEELGEVHVNGRAVPITMSAVRGADGERVWVFSSQTVAQIPALYRAYANRWIDRLPRVFVDFFVWELALWQWLGLLAISLLSIGLGMMMSWVGTRLTVPFLKRTPVEWDDELFLSTRGPLRILTVLLAFRALLPLLELNPPARDALGTVMVLILVFAIAWLVMRLVRFTTIALEQHATKRSGGQHELRLRGVRTQLFVLRRIVNILIGVLAVALGLMQFEAVRNVGVSMLASAGVAGIVLGLAAQKPIGALLAGLQMSVTQPIRIGDAVVVHNEFGTIEEIKLSHVIVKIWDERRLIVPTTYFLDNTFQNWTRFSPQLTGQVLLFADFALPVDAMRAELGRILENEPLWDRRTSQLVVVDTVPDAIQLRVLVSAGDAGTLFQLRCLVRERLIAWLRDFEHGRYLPRRRYNTDISEPHEPRRASSPHATSVRDFPPAS